MRRNYISREFDYSNISGTFNMKDVRSFFGSKMMEIEDFISITDRTIVYYNNVNGEQLDSIVESSGTPILYSMPIDKLVNHKIEINRNQGQESIDRNTEWILTVDIGSMLSNYIFANIKNNRVFDGVMNSNTVSNSVDSAIRDYISSNIFGRYRYSNIDFFISYNDLSGSNVLRFKNDWSPNIGVESNIFSRLNTDLSADKKILTIKFKQDKGSLNFNFSYYFNIFFEKA